MGHPCPEEVEVVRAVVPQLIRDLDVDTESYLEINMVQEYVDALIQEHRAQKYLALDNDMIPRSIGIDQATGIPIWQDDMSPALSNKERAQRKKEKLRKEFVATREMRLKFKVATPEDESQKAAAMRKQMEEAIQRQAQEAKFEDIEEERENAT